VWGLALGTWATAAGAWWQLARVHRTHPHVFTGGQDRRS
jgi:putative component of membrane protein insertase Oxa1/YidC/SpoIIIJ protein YidD